MGWRATWLADEFRKAGLVVVEVEGWKNRGYDFPDSPAEEGVSIFHHTASNRNSGPAGGLRIVAYGREGLAGPIANWLTARNGVIYVVAAGVSNNAGKGNARAAGLPGTTGNSNTLANEMENDGIGEPYPAVQRTAALISHAVVHRKMGWPASRGIGHLEWSVTGKIDPLVRTWGPMSVARTQLAAVMAGNVPAKEEDDMFPDKLKVPGATTPIPSTTREYNAKEALEHTVRRVSTVQEQLAAERSAAALRHDQLMAAVRQDQVVAISPETIQALVYGITDGVVARLDIEVDAEIVAQLKTEVAADISARISNG